MNRTLRLSVALAVASAVAVPVANGTVAAVSGPTAGAAMPPLYKNCTNLNKTYKHGVGRANAKDKSPNPVTTFKRSTKTYNLAMSYNKGLDRDKDFVACEKA
jgi:hypothetical protein